MRFVVSSVLVLALGVGCASTGGDGPQPLIRKEDRFFLRAPTEGYPRAVGPTPQRRLDEAFRKLVEEGETTPASRLSADLLGQNPDLDPARVLAAQVDFVNGIHAGVVSRLEPVVAGQPNYLAAQLLFGRSSEKLGNLIEAVEAYQGIADQSSVASTRANELRTRAVEILALRIEDSLAKGRTADAQRELVRLQEWAPADVRTLESTAAVAAAVGDQELELKALRNLTQRSSASQADIERCAELELEIGDPSTGMRLLESLVAAHPDDTELADKVTRARFTWRLQLLPPEARQLAGDPELTRADFATLLFWLFPDIRYGRAQAATIANDVLDHPHREQIVRVVNMGLMDVDPSVHRFEPYRPLQRGQALASMLRLLARRQPPFACLGGRSAPPSSSFGVCETAGACGLLPDVADCLPTATVSGREALELSRLTQELLGVQ